MKKHLSYIIHTVSIRCLFQWKHDYSFLVFIIWILWYRFCESLIIVCIIIHKSRLLDDVLDIHQLVQDDRTRYSGLLVCIGWVIAQQQAIRLIILVIMCLSSQRVQMIFKALLPNLSTKTVTHSSQQTYYCFEVYHHQRWWVATGWGHCLLPQDPPAW